MSRYYDSNTGRFISADGYISTGQGILGNNMYAYCGNNPVMRVDCTGHCWLECIVEALCIGACGVYIYYQLKQSNEYDNRQIESCDATDFTNKRVSSQHLPAISEYSYGNYSLDYNGCEVIAVHNAKILKGLDSSLSGTINDFYDSNAMLGVSGWLGSNPFEIGNVLSKTGLDYTRVGANQLNTPGIYIVSYITTDFQIHTIAMSYDGNTYQYYNTSHQNPETPYLGVFYLVGYYLGE